MACMAVPAEEYVEVGYRLGLREAGKIEFLGGKPELLRVGAFDDVDMAMMVHTSSNRADGLTGVSESSNGCVVKQITFLGHAAHAGGAPHRRHQRAQRGDARLAGDSCQPGDVPRPGHDPRASDHYARRGHRECGAGRGADGDLRPRSHLKAITEANRKVDRALQAGALAVGAKVRIETLPGYLPLCNDPELTSLYKDNAVTLVGADEVREVETRGGSTDMGDLTQIMPGIIPTPPARRGPGTATTTTSRTTKTPCCSRRKSWR